MSEYCREQHPLLDEASEEEHYNSQYFRRRPMISRKTRNNIKGAAAIITHWPDHWSSFLTYWWIGLGMISLTTFVIYNSMFAFNVLPAAAFRPSNPTLSEIIKKTTPTAHKLTETFMHVFVNQNKEIDLTDYVPHIEEFSKEYSSFKYHLVFVINDTNVTWLSAEENNEIALNMLWNKDDNTSRDREKSKINVQYITLSSYMDNSPIVKYWRFLSPPLIEFLVRAVSVWDKRGIAFNPNILTDMSQRSLYLDKLHNLFHKYSRVTNKKNDEINRHPESVAKRVKGERKYNNIRDIINALDKDNESTNFLSKQSLVEAENIILPSVIKQEPSTSELSENKAQEKNQTIYQISLIPGSFNFTKENLLKSSIKGNDLSQNTTNITKPGLLPQFLDYLFRNKADTAQETKVRKRKNVVDLPKYDRSRINTPIHTTDKLENIEKEFKPVIVTAPETFLPMEKEKAEPQIQRSELENTLQLNQLTIDLKGNIIATDTACHAFLGTIFTNAVHYSDIETVTDFIISELTIFCKGVLSSCKGIELILL